jgi:cytochrome c biogenesis protein CcdA
MIISARPKTLVLKEFRIDSESGSVLITGRTPGLGGFLLTLLGLDATTSLFVSPKTTQFRASSLSGEMNVVVPTPNVASMECGFYKPILAFVTGIILMLGACMALLGSMAQMTSQDRNVTLFVAGLLGVVGVICLLNYILEKKILVQFETSGGRIFGIAFKRSVIENVPVDIKAVKQAITVFVGNLARIKD